MAKQTKVETNFRDLDGRFVKLLGDLDLARTRILNTMTGGDTYPWIIPGPLNDGRPVFRLIANAEGTDPLHDLDIELVEVTPPPRGLPQKTSFACLRPETARVSDLEVYLPPKGATVEVTIHATAANGVFRQHHHFVQTGGRWDYATRVFRVRAGGDVELRRHVTLGFPPDIEWDKDA